jgi:flavin reductase (DIM6/NTAB) family NADH-FMN oxidoreductase RutF
MHQRVDARELSGREAYRWMVDTIVPRPVAWITSLSSEGVVNLAPFSYFSGVCSRPPTLAVSIANKRGGQPKDTLHNIRQRGEFVVHIAATQQAQQLNASAVEAPPTVSEAGLLGLELLPSARIDVPRLAEARVAMECRCSRIIDHGDGPGVGLVLGEILCWHVEPALLRKDGRLPAVNLDPLARLGGQDYAELGTVFSLERPAWDPSRPAPVGLGSKGR